MLSDSEASVTNSGPGSSAATDSGVSSFKLAFTGWRVLIWCAQTLRHRADRPPHRTNFWPVDSRPTLFRRNNHALDIRSQLTIKRFVISSSSHERYVFHHVMDDMSLTLTLHSHYEKFFSVVSLGVSITDAGLFYEPHLTSHLSP